MGPTLLFHLGADENGLATFCERYAGSFNRWWDDPAADSGRGTVAEPSVARDELLTRLVAATHRGGRRAT